MRELEGKRLLTLKEASEKYFVPVHWIRRQLGKPILPDGSSMRWIKFPSDRNVYVFESEVEEISKPMVYSQEFIDRSQRDYDKDPDADDSDFVS